MTSDNSALIAELKAPRNDFPSYLHDLAARAAVALEASKEAEESRHWQYPDTEESFGPR